ncbi:MAG: hypothetical protein FWD79_03805 [Desulfobulbus sp.]|nr:hypothetical protein [Desulfobulbus sp.]
MKYLSLVVLPLLFLLSSCATKGQTDAAGATADAPIGHKTSATLTGAAAGGMLGYIVGNKMDTYDREQLNHTYERGVSNQRSAWINPDTGNQYAITPQPAYQDPGTRQVCRRAEIEAIIDSKPQHTYSTACRDPHGSWQLQ